MNCSRQGCTVEAEWYPIMLLYANRKRHPDAPPARAICGIPICTDHMGEMTVEYLLSDQGYEELATMFRKIGKIAPDRSATRIEFGRLDSNEWREWQRSKH